MEHPGQVQAAVVFLFALCDFVNVVPDLVIMKKVFITALAILVVAGLVTGENPYNEVYGRTADSLRTLHDKAAKARVKIGCENCNAEHRFLISPREFWQLAGLSV